MLSDELQSLAGRYCTMLRIRAFEHAAEAARQGGVSAFGLWEASAAQHSRSFESCFAHLPGGGVCPATPQDNDSLLRTGVPWDGEGVLRVRPGAPDTCWRCTRRHPPLTVIDPLP